MPVFEQVTRTAQMGGNAVHLGEIQVTGGQLVLATRLLVEERGHLRLRPLLRAQFLPPRLDLALHRLELGLRPGRGDGRSPVLVPRGVPRWG